MASVSEGSDARKRYIQKVKQGVNALFGAVSKQAQKPASDSII